MRRLVIAAAVLAAVLAAGCVHRAPPVNEVVFWQTWPAATITPLVRGFEAENPGVHVRIVTLPRESVHDSIAVAVAAGHPPDLCEVGSADLSHELAAGTLSDWSAGVADLRDSILGWPTCMVGDAIYGVPWQLGTRALFYNRSLLEHARAANGRAPETWDQLASAAARVQRLGHGVHGFGMPSPGSDELFAAFMPFAWGDDGELLSERQDSSRFDCPGNLEALAYWQRLRRASLTGSQDSLEREFAAGRLGFLLSGTSLFARLPARFPFGVALVPRPGADRGEHASYAGAEVLVSFTGSRRKELALRLARWLVRPANALALAIRGVRGEPATAGADSAVWYRAHPDRQVLVRQAATARFAPQRAGWDSMLIAVDEQVGLAVAGRKSAMQAIEDADERLEVLVARKGR